MKSSWDLDPATVSRYSKMVAFDRAEIDQRDRCDPDHLHYMNRIGGVLRLVRRLHPDPAGVRVGEFGCAQGNTSLVLAEAGYRTWAIDLDPDRLQYSRAKYERGEVEWVCGYFGSLTLPEELFELAIVGEVIEFSAYPEQTLATVARFVRPGGHMIVTTPNGSRAALKSPPMSQALAGDRKQLETRQFRDVRLFKVPPSAWPSLTPPGCELLESGYFGGTILVNRLTAWTLRPLSDGVVQAFLRAVSRTPVLNRFTSKTIYAVFRKKSA
jgi:2-polyprenyl-3-methyl-5-hydroxy-6-metoxy-1,4-benzoquinol methylase